MTAQQLFASQENINACYTEWSVIARERLIPTLDDDDWMNPASSPPFLYSFLLIILYIFLDGGTPFKSSSSHRWDGVDIYVYIKKKKKKRERERVRERCLNTRLAACNPASSDHDRSIELPSTRISVRLHCNSSIKTATLLHFTRFYSQHSGIPTSFIQCIVWFALYIQFTSVYRIIMAVMMI